MYKKYIVKKGKKIGPYFYESVRLQNGVVKTIYLGNNEQVALQKVKQHQVALRQEKSTNVKEKHKDIFYVLVAIVFVLLGFLL